MNLATKFSSCFQASPRSSSSHLWNDFLDRFSQTAGKISWYPSCGDDFRPLLYQQKKALTHLGISVPGAYTTPDLWMFSDYHSVGMEGGDWRETGFLQRSAKTSIRVTAICELTPCAEHFIYRYNRANVHFDPAPSTGMAYYLHLEIECQVLGSWKAEAVYFCYDNINLLEEFFLRHQVPISHLTWIRDGSGFGGGRFRHDFLMELAPLMNVRWMFIWDKYLRYKNDNEWPRELQRWQLAANEFKAEIGRLGDISWGSEQVYFCEQKMLPPPDDSTLPRLYPHKHSSRLLENQRRDLFSAESKRHRSVRSDLENESI